jgi:hypothetical protein
VDGGGNCRGPWPPSCNTHLVAATAFTHSTLPHPLHSTDYRPAGSTHDGHGFGAGTIDFTATEEEGWGWQGQIDQFNLYYEKKGKILHSELPYELNGSGQNHEPEDISFRRGKGHCSTLFNVESFTTYTVTLAITQGRPPRTYATEWTVS